MILAAAGCSRTALTVDDAVVSAESRELHCRASVEREPFMFFRSSLPGVPVEFRLDGRPVATARTEADGFARAVVPYSKPRRPRIEARADVLGRSLTARGTIHTWRRDRTIVAVDIDNTLAKTKLEDLLFERDGEDEESTPLKGSRKVMEVIAADCEIIYVTARPRFLLDTTRAWLVDEDFPFAPVMTSDGIRQAMHRREYKLDRLAALQQEWPHLLIGIGNSPSDHEAYTRSGMLAVLVNQKKKVHQRAARTIYLRTWRDLAEFWQANRALLTDPARLRAALADDTIDRLLDHSAEEEDDD